MNDGSITFATDLDNKELEKQLNSLTKKISSIEGKIAQKTVERMPLAEQAEQLVGQLDVAKAKLYEMQNAARGAYSADEIKEQKETMASLQAQWNAVETKVERYDTAIQNATIELDRNKEQAGAITQELATASSNSTALGGAIDQVGARLDGIFTRIKRLATRVLFFSVITMALRSIREWLGSIIKVNPQATAAIARLKGALLTLAQPLVNVVIPAFTALVNILTRVAAAIAQVVSMIFGTTLSASAKSAKSLNDQTKALNSAGAAADKASKSFASFDEIDQLPDSGGGGGGGSDTAIAPDFSGGLGDADNKMKDLLATIGAIAAGLLAWKVAQSFGASLKLAAGLAVALAGAVLLVTGYLDAWTNGVNWTNFSEILNGLILLAGGLGIAFGPVAAAIALIAGGLALLVLGFKDLAENGMSLQNVLLIIAGLFAGGLGISLLTHSWIPVLIAAILSIVVAALAMTGNLEEFVKLGKKLFDDFVGFFKALIFGDWSKAWEYAGKIVDDFKNIILLIWDSLKKAINMLCDQIIDKVGGTNNVIGNIINVMKDVFNGVIKFIEGVFSGDWKKAWEGITDIFKGIVNGIANLFTGMINAIIDGWNWLIGKLNAIHIEMPDWIESKFGIGSIGFNIPPIDHVSIPALATGAVIPPNREFMAVLGDQKSGYNIEAPEELIRRIVREESGGGDGDINLTVVATLDGEVIYRNQKKVSRRHGPVLA